MDYELTMTTALKKLAKLYPNETFSIEINAWKWKHDTKIGEINYRIWSQVKSQWYEDITLERVLDNLIKNRVDLEREIK